MPRKKKFTEGAKIKTLYDVVGELVAGRWIMLRGVPKHPRLIANMTISTIEALLRGEGALSYAIDSELESWLNRKTQLCHVEQLSLKQIEELSWLNNKLDAHFKSSEPPEEGST